MKNLLGCHKYSPRAVEQTAKATLVRVRGGVGELRLLPRSSFDGAVSHHNPGIAPGLPGLLPGFPIRSTLVVGVARAAHDEGFAHDNAAN